MLAPNQPTVSLVATPGITVDTFDRDAGAYRVVGLHIGPDLTFQIAHWHSGDAGIVAVTGALIDALSALRANARQRIAAAHAGLPALPDGVEPATMAEAMAGWTSASEPDLPDTTGYGRLGAAWAQQSKERIPEDAICEDADLGTWAPGELQEAFGS